MGGQKLWGTKGRKLFCTRLSGQVTGHHLHCSGIADLCPIWAWYASLDVAAILDGVHCEILDEDCARFTALAAEAITLIRSEGDVAVDVFDDGLKQSDRHAPFGCPRKLASKWLVNGLKPQYTSIYPVYKLVIITYNNPFTNHPICIMRCAKPTVPFQQRSMLRFL